ncbi:MAG: hypothetical protein U0103_10935 [Candidatus Obscuribacterales bacterium]
MLRLRAQNGVLFKSNCKFFRGVTSSSFAATFANPNGTVAVYRLRLNVSGHFVLQLWSISLMPFVILLGVLSGTDSNGSTCVISVDRNKVPAYVGAGLYLVYTVLFALYVCRILLMIVGSYFNLYPTKVTFTSRQRSSLSSPAALPLNTCLLMLVG